VGNGIALEWVNHASFVLDYDGVRLISDPWLEGKVFNNGWSLLSDTVFGYPDFQNITHIWFSHEHPDHFFPPNLKAIPPAIRRSIPILYQRTKDRKVAKFCKGLGFKEIIELQPSRWLALSSSLSVLCRPVPDDDSWMALKTDRGTILNINDCVIDTTVKAQAIAEVVGPVNVLMTQFSYAQWAGNPEDRESRHKEAREKLVRIAIQAGVFKPQYVIPFASFVWFSHEENFYLNDTMNDAEGVARFIEDELGCKPVVLYPGDRWEVGSAHDWRPAAARYRQDFEARMRGGPITMARPVAYGEIEAASRSFLDRLGRKNRLLRYVPLPSTCVKLLDLNLSVLITSRGLRRVDDQHPIDISMNAESLLYCLRFDWGANTLHVNGRFRSAHGNSYQKFFRFFRIADDNNHGRRLDPGWIAAKLINRGSRAVSHALGRAR